MYISVIIVNCNCTFCPGGIKSKAITKSKQKLIYLHLPNDLLTI